MCLRSVFAIIISKVELHVSGADILASLEVATAVYQSATSGNVPVSLPLQDRVNRYGRLD